MAFDIITKVLVMDAVYWPPNGLNNYSVQTYAAAIALKVRWVDSNELYLGAKGEQLISKSSVMVGQDVEKDGVLWKGLLSSLSGANLTNPFLNANAGVIKAFLSVPTIDATQTLRIALLGGGGSMP